MDCRDVRPLISAYMDNEVTPQELRVMQGHVAECAECAALLASYRSLRSTIRALPQPVPPPALRQAVFARATPAYRRRALLFEFGQQGLAAAAMAVVVLAVVFTVSLLRSQPPTPIPVPGVTPPLPSVLTVEPESGTIEWGTNRPVRITFSAPMDREATRAAIRFAFDPPEAAEDEDLLRATMEWENDDSTLVIGRHGGLRPDTDYRIWLEPSLARDRQGRSLQPDNTRLIFRTEQGTTQAYAPTSTAATVAHAPLAATPTPPTPTPTATATPTAPAASPSPAPAPPGVPAGQAATSPPAPTPASVPPPPQQAPPPPPAPPPAPAAPATATAPPTRPAATPTSTPSLTFEVSGAFGQLYDGNAAVRTRLGPPLAPATQAPVAVLQFERGLMYRRGDSGAIYVLFAEQPGVWYSFADTWSEGSPPGGGAAPQAGLYLPKRGFGKVWRDNPDFERRLGYALTPDEQTFTAPVQPFEGGLMLWSQAAGQQSPGRWVYVLYANGTYERYAE